MNSQHVFSGLTTQTVAEIVGTGATALLMAIEQGMEHGTHWRWTSRMIYTQAGVEFIVAQLRNRGHKRAAESLETALRNAVRAEAEAAELLARHAAIPAQFPDESERPRDHSKAHLADREGVNFMQEWEAAHP